MLLNKPINQMKASLTILFLCLGLVSLSQTTYQNNLGANYVNGKTGPFVKSSVAWTITQDGSNYKLKTNVSNEVITVTYSKQDEPNNLYIYRPVGIVKFEGGLVISVMTSGKLSDFAKGKSSEVNILAIRFTDETGFIYRLGR